MDIFFAMIRVYSTPQCAFCRQAKDYLKGKGVDFEEVNLIGNPEAQQLVMQKTAQFSVPVVEINGEFLVGFNRPEIDKRLSPAKMTE